MSPQCLPSSFEFSSSEFPRLPHASHQVSDKSNIQFESRCRFKIWWPSWILEYKDLAILNLHVTPMPPTKFGLNLTYHSGADVVWRFSGWPPWRSFWTLERNDFSNSESLCCSDAYHQVSAQSDLMLGRRGFLKIFKMADMVAIFDIEKI